VWVQSLFALTEHTVQQVRKGPDPMTDFEADLWSGVTCE
jgi:hypothetical protein